MRDETWTAWTARLRGTIAQAAQGLNIPLNNGIINRRLPNRQQMNSPRQSAQAPPPIGWPEDITFDTVHGVKGEEFEIVALYCPRPRNQGLQRCITTQWWNNEQAEERRVAYVATTRAKRVFLLCVHETTYAALQAQQPAFFASFREPV